MRTKTKAVIAWKAGVPPAMGEVDLQDLRTGEVLVGIKVTSIYHTDYCMLSDIDPEGVLPAILGHKGADVMLEMGTGVTSLKAGDHVIPLYTPKYHQYRFCLLRRASLCQAIRATQGRGLMPGGTSRFSLNGKSLFHYMGTSTFTNHIMAPEIALVRIRPGAPLDEVCCIGCGVTAGVRTMVYMVKVEPGTNMVVFDLGSIGLNMIQSAKMVGADKIIDVNLNPACKAMARKFSITYFIDPSDVENVVDYIIQLTDGDADYSFEYIGNTKVMRQTLKCRHRDWGQSAIIGMAGADTKISTCPPQLVTGHRQKGSAFDGARGRIGVPRIVDWYMEGEPNVDNLIMHTLPPERISEGSELVERGKSIRSVMLYRSLGMEPRDDDPSTDT